MTKITLHKHPKQDRYRAVIGRNGTGWAYPLKQYKNGDVETLEAMIDQQGTTGTAVYRFTFDGANWKTNSEPISQNKDGIS